MDTPTPTRPGSGDYAVGLCQDGVRQPSRARSYLRLLLVGSAWQTVSIAVIRLVPMILVVILALYGRPGDLGVYSYIIATYTVLSLIADMGISYAYPKFIQEDIENSADIISTALYLRILFSLVLGVVCWAADHFLSLFKGQGFYIGLLLFTSSFSVIVITFNARLRFKQASLIVGSQAFVWLFLGVLLIRSGMYVRGPVYALTLAFTVNLLYGIYYDGISMYLRFNPRQARRILEYGLLAMVAGVLVMFTTQCGTLTIAYLMHNSDVGIFKLALTFSVVPILLSYIVTAPLMPVLRKSIVAGDGSTAELLKQLTTYLVMISFLILGAGLILAGPAIRLFFAKQFLAGIITLRILILANTIGLLFNVLIFVPFMADDLGAAIKISGIVGLVCLVLDVIFIIWLGIDGAAIGLTISYGAGLALIVYWLRKNMQFHVDWRKCACFALPCVETLCAGILLTYAFPIISRARMAFYVVLIPALYIFLLVLQGGLKTAEIRKLFNLLRPSQVS